MPPPNDTGRTYSEADIDHIVAKRLQEREKQKQEEAWVAGVNAAIEAINRHVSADGAHPRLLDLMGRAVQATERMERMIMTVAPEDIQKFLPMAIERERRKVSLT